MRLTVSHTLKTKDLDKLNSAFLNGHFGISLTLCTVNCSPGTASALFMLIREQFSGKCVKFHVPLHHPQLYCACLCSSATPCRTQQYTVWLSIDIYALTCVSGHDICCRHIHRRTPQDWSYSLLSLTKEAMPCYYSLPVIGVIL